MKDPKTKPADDSLAGGRQMPDTSPECDGSLLIVAGHAVYQDRVWHGGFPNEDHIYEQHVRDGFELAAEHRYTALVLSGGRTRTDRGVNKSEAQGMFDLATEKGLQAIAFEVLVEPWARDSFENVFFSTLRYHRRFERWPARIGVVSWKFKALRFYLIACGLRFGDGNFTFYGSGDPISRQSLEITAAANARYDASIVWVKAQPEIMDPFHRDPEEFGKKRLRRMPAEFATDAEYLAAVKQAYDGSYEPVKRRQGPVGEVIDRIEKIVPGPSWRCFDWP